MYNFTITRIFPVLSTGPILCLKISLLLDLAGLKKKKKKTKATTAGTSFIITNTAI